MLGITIHDVIKSRYEAICSLLSGCLLNQFLTEIMLSMIVIVLKIVISMLVNFVAMNRQTDSLQNSQIDSDN